MAITSFQFGDPKPTPDNFKDFSKSDLQADTKVKASAVLQPIPPPRADPPAMSLDGVLGKDATAQIQAAGEIALHVAGRYRRHQGTVPPVRSR